MSLIRFKKWKTFYIENLDDLFALFPQSKQSYDKMFSRSTKRWQNIVTELLKTLDVVFIYEELYNKGMLITVISENAIYIKLELITEDARHLYNLNLLYKNISLSPEKSIFNQIKEKEMIGESPNSLKDAVAYFETILIKNKLKENKMNKEETAKLLGISLSSLYRKMDELDIKL